MLSIILLFRAHSPLSVLHKENDMKWFLIGLFIAIGILDVLLIMGCAKLERMREKNERDNRENDK